jgi:heterotetrameric sarcosine oxidase delta subunit
VRQNPAGIQFERWLHLYACGRWFNVARDTRTHEILKVYSMGEPKPALEASP